MKDRPRFRELVVFCTVSEKLVHPTKAYLV